MSPASQGALEVERYVGSCLISGRPLGCLKQELRVSVKPQQQQQQQHHHQHQQQSQQSQQSQSQQQQQQFTGTWAGGAPLISMATNPRRNAQPADRVPLSRLAVHTQGAPLILSGRFPGNRGKPPGGLANTPNKQSQQNGPRKPPANDQKKAQQTKDAPATGGNVANIDSLSIASDESSGSNNSENSLPRIIKPRKRRKKDRKPPVVSPGEVKDEPSIIPAEQHREQAAQQPKSYPTIGYDGYYKPAGGGGGGVGAGGGPRRAGNASYARLHPGSEPVDTRQNYRQHVKLLDDNRNVIMPVPVCQAKGGYLRPGGYLHTEADECGLQGAAVCQCRYCDPATLIWDVAEQQPGYCPQFIQGEFNRHHRHHHHHHHHRFSQVPTTVYVARPLICQEHDLFDVEDPCLRIREKPDGSAILRRSWSDPTSYFSEEIVPNRDVGVIGDRGQLGDSPKGRSSWRGDASTAPPRSMGNHPASPTNGSSNGSGSPGHQGPLEVSTEIVTSPNGHRDLEIKFYSSSISPDEGKTAFVFPEDDSEELSDIWSYHESKLQQDFRTLLQAEE